MLADEIYTMPHLRLVYRRLVLVLRDHTTCLYIIIVLLCPSHRDVKYSRRRTTDPLTWTTHSTSPKSICAHKELPVLVPTDRYTKSRLACLPACLCSRLTSSTAFCTVFTVAYCCFYMYIQQLLQSSCRLARLP